MWCPKDIGEVASGAEGGAKFTNIFFLKALTK